MTRGMLCLNPFNLMHNAAFSWQGEVLPTRDPLGRLCSFDELAHGLRAGAMNLKNYQVRHGLNTWGAIIPRYAPGADDNDVAAYIKAMDMGTGVNSTTPFDLTAPVFLFKASLAMIRHEQGNIPIDPNAVRNGVNAALDLLA